MLHRLKKPDPLIVLILAAVAIAIIAPARGTFADVFGNLTNVAIALLFFLYGARLSTQEALNGLKHWRLHLTILAFTFVIYPLIGLALRPLTGVITDDMYMGILFLTLVPSTVQSSVAFTSIAKGNVSGAIVSASTSNLAGVFITPVLVMLLMGTGSGLHIDTSVFGEISLLLLAPFILGQLTRRWITNFAQSKATKVVDRGSIAMVVYSAFSKGVVDPRGFRRSLRHLHVVADAVYLQKTRILTRRYHRYPILRIQEVLGHWPSHGLGHLCLRVNIARAIDPPAHDLPPGAANDLFCVGLPVRAGGRGATTLSAHG